MKSGGVNVREINLNSVADGKYTYDTASSLMKAIQAFDTNTYIHSINVANLAYLIGSRMRLSENVCRNLFLGGLLHDIGKLGVPGHILNKKAKLTEEDYSLIKAHPQIGHGILNVSIFQEKEIELMALYHHERLNGSGYPSGLTGDTIPISAKIIAVADVYDAMTADRSYRSALTHEKAMRHLLDNSDVLYDRIVIQAFREAIEDNSRNLFDKNFSVDVPRKERRCAE